MHREGLTVPALGLCSSGPTSVLAQDSSDFRQYEGYSVLSEMCTDAREMMRKEKHASRPV